jgi:hypothetical protein
MIPRQKVTFYHYRGARRDLGLVWHTRLAFMLVRNDRLGHVEQRSGKDSETKFS